MTTWQRLHSRADPEIGGIRVLDVLAAVALSVFAVLLTSGVTHTHHPHGGGGAAVGVLAMTAPVAWCRRAPLAAASVLAAGALLNGVIFGPMVRCGAALPAVYLVAFAIGSRRDGNRWATGLVLCAVDVLAQSVYDPNLGLAALVFVLPPVCGFFALGRFVRSRTAATELLRAQSVDLRRRREATARMSVAADRARLSQEFDGRLRDRIDDIAATAETAREALAIDPDGPTASNLVRQELSSIEHRGREVLRYLRDVLGSLDEASPTEPQPTLDALPALLARATSADARLTIAGNPRRLPAGLELSGYRIVEQLLLALRDAPDARIDVGLSFTADAFELRVSGPPAGDVDLAAVLDAARGRAELHHGTLEGATHNGVCRASALLPLVSGSA